MLNLVDELKKFSDELLEMGKDIHDNRVENFEKLYNLTLPLDYKKFIKEVNGFSLMGTEVYGFDVNKTEAIESVYHFEHFEVRLPQYTYIVPFSPDGRGNFYCFDTSKLIDESCSIVFWVSNFEYSDTEMPEITHTSFLSWAQEVVIDWILEDYNYDGSEK